MKEFTQLKGVSGWVFRPFLTDLSCRLKKTSPCKAEWFGCFRHEQDHDLHYPHGYRGPFLQWTSGFDRAFPERDLHPQCITFCPPRNSKKQQEANHQFLTKTSPQTSPKQQKYLQYPQETLGLCFSQRPNTECLDACLLGGGGICWEISRLKSSLVLNACVRIFCVHGSRDD